MSYDIVHEKSIEILTDWVEKTIYIHTRQGIENEVYSLLHECGHLLIFLDNKSFERSYPMYAYAATKRQEGTNKWKVSVIAEEYEAWKRGRKLATKLNIPVDKKKYDKAMTDAIMSYIRWAG